MEGRAEALSESLGGFDDPRSAALGESGSWRTPEFGTESRIRRLTIRQLAGVDYERWVRVGALIAAIGYSLSWMFTAYATRLGAFPHLWSEVFASIAGWIAVGISRRWPTRAAILTLGSVWLELQFGFLTSVRPYPIGTLVTGALVAATGVLVGSRGALVMAILSSIATPIFVDIGLARIDQHVILDSDLWHYYLVHAIGTIAIWALVSLGLRAFAHAVTKARDSERQAGESLRYAPDGILLVNDQGEVAFVNPAAERILGVMAGAALDRHVNDVLESAGAADEVRFVLHPARALGLPLAVALHRDEGNPTYIEVTTRRMADGREQWMLRDVSERVRAEQQRRSMETQLSHVQRMEAVGRLAGGIAHDFNNLLTAIGASAEMLAASASDEDRELLEEIVAAQSRGRTLTRQLLAFARRDVVQPRVFDVGAQVDELRRLLGRVAGERVELKFALETECRVVADVGQFEQALVNLVSNARDAMPDGGTCELLVERRGDRVLVRVADNGTGMDEATRRQAFEPFFTTKERGKGTGLGLASVHGIIAASGGAVMIDSTVGKGTIVTLDFPRTDLALEATPAPRSGESTAVREGAVLVADDDPAVRSAVRRILAQAGYAVTFAVDGLEAARLAEARSAPFDLLVTDVMMPGLTGPQLAARLRVRWPALPVLFMSGYPEDALAEVPDLSIDRDFLAKPFGMQELRRRVAELLPFTPASA